MVSRIHNWVSGEVLTAAQLNAEFDNLVTAGNTVSTDATPGPVELATAAEISAGTDASRAMTPDAFAASNFGKRYVGIACFAPATNCATGDGKGFFVIPTGLDGMNLIEARAGVYTAGVTGTMDIQVRNITQSADMLSSKVQIASAGVTAGGVPDPANDDVAVNDRIAIDVDTIQTTPAKGLIVVLGFALP